MPIPYGDGGAALLEKRLGWVVARELAEIGLEAGQSPFPQPSMARDGSVPEMEGKT
jgi:hypothetical protein